MTFIIQELKQQQLWESVQYISAKGLVPIIQQTFANKDKIFGVEIGVAGGWNMNYFLDNIPNLNLTGIDPFEAYVETRGSDGAVEFVPQSILDSHYNAAIENTKMFSNAKIIRSKSSAVADIIDDNSLDYIFIDGDHSYEAVLNDCRLYYKKVRSGGIFAGHDIGLQTVQSAISTFVSETPELSITQCLYTEHSVWYFYKP